MSAHRRAIALALSLAGSEALAAQLAPGVTLQPGTDVRVTLPSPASRVRGRLHSVDRDRIRLQRGDAAPRALAFANVQRVSLRQGRDRRRGMKLGAAILGGVALVFGGVDASRGVISVDDYIGTVVGNTAIGALLGAAAAPRGWIDVPLAR